MRAPTAARAVPFLDLGPMHRDLRESLLSKFGELIDSGAFINGPQVADFELALAAYTGRRACVGLASGLDALRLALLAAGIEPGDEVVVPAQTFVATVEAVTQAGGRPVLADVSETDYNLDPEAAAAAVTPNTRFLVPVHLFGQLADLRRLGELAARSGLELLEDACQSHGARRDGVCAGGFGRAAAFSFYPAKNLGAMGDAGALVTDDEGLAAVVRGLREHGQAAKYRHVREGYTARLDTIQAIVLLHKLPLLDGWNATRAEVAGFYLEALAEIGDLRLPPVAPGSEPAWHVFVVRTGDPTALASFLRDRGIDTARHYPDPVHLTPAYEYLGYRPGAFPVAEALARDALSLPLYPGISAEQLELVVAAIRDFFADG
jgi:dTDP-4-amino-4,6-dideoxygalactose transaminase